MVVSPPILLRPGINAPRDVPPYPSPGGSAGTAEHKGTAHFRREAHHSRLAHTYILTDRKPARWIVEDEVVGHQGGDIERGAPGPKVIMESAKLLGDKTALGALKQGEESGVKDYQQALGEETLPSEAKSLIQTTLLPRQQAHVAELDGIIQAVDKLEEAAEKAEEEAGKASQ